MAHPLRRLVALAILAAPIAAQCPLVADINTIITPFDSNPSIARVGAGSSFAHGMLQCGGDWFFVASAAGTGAELWKTDGTVAGTVMVKDINPGIESSDPQYLTCCNGRVFFRATTATAGEELWVSDGTAAGTILIRDIVPGSANSRPSNLCCLNNAVLFTANDGVTGFELWRSDGTPAGTAMLLDIRPGALSSAPHDYKRDFLGIKVYFQADDGVHGKELWTSDGTAAGTVMVKDIQPGPGGSAPVYFIENPSNPLQLLFRADDGSTGMELWRTDGTVAGTVMVKDIRPGALGAALNMYHSSHSALGGRIYFNADDGLHGGELWTSDGTAAGTYLVQDINPGLVHSDPTMFRVSGNTLFMQACTTADGCELYQLVGTTVSQVRDLWRGIDGSSPAQLTPLPGGQVMFSADTGTTGTGRELWISDGTRAGTRLLQDIWSGGDDGDPEGFTPIPGGQVLFFASDGTNGGPGREVFVTDGTATGTGLFFDTWPGGASNSSSPNFLTGAHGAALYFSADDGLGGRELWRADANGAALLADIDSGSEGSDPSGFVDLWTGTEALTVFTADNGQKGEELWVTDGTSAGTRLLADIWNGPESSSPNNFGRLRNRAVFSARTAATGYELWATDGTAAGTVLVKDIEPGSGSSLPHAFAAVGDTLFFAAISPSTSGRELWRTDGTAAGTALVKDIWPGSHGSAPRYLTPFGDMLLFSANDGPNGVELWRSDGTAAGTVMVGNFAPASYGLHPANLTPFGDAVYFAGSDNTFGTELWKTDGTAAGTVLVKDIQPGNGGSLPRALTVSQGRLFFAADDGAIGMELYVTDGSAAGTTLVADIHPGPFSSSPTHPIDAGTGVYFTAEDGNGGRELFFSDGTAAGTYQVCDLLPGPQSAYQSELVAVDGTLYFTADDGMHGFELFRLGGTPAVVEHLGASCGPALPTLDATNPIIGGVAILSGNGLPASARLLLFGRRGTPLPLPGLLASDCAIWSDLAVSTTLFLPPGSSWSLPFPIPGDNSLIGVTLLVQTVEGSLPFSASNAVQVTLGT